jgi:hypothetical protein
MRGFTVSNGNYGCYGKQSAMDYLNALSHKSLGARKGAQRYQINCRQ